MTELERKIKEIAPTAKRWIESDDGKKEIKKALQDAKELTDQFNRARQIDPKSLQEPVTL